MADTVLIINKSVGRYPELQSVNILSQLLQFSSHVNAYEYSTMFFVRQYSVDQIEKSCVTMADEIAVYCQWPVNRVNSIDMPKICQLNGVHKQ